MILSGGTGSGKTFWIMHFIENIKKIIDRGPISKILYCYGELNDKIIELGKIENDDFVVVHSGLPTEQFIHDMAAETGIKFLVVLDDLLVGIKTSFLDSLFTRGSHNWGASVILLTQNLFAKELRTARSNSHYLVLMRNPAGELQIRNLSSQLFPQKTQYFLESYKSATTKKFTYLLVDLHPDTDDRLRLKTHIYPDEITIVFSPKQS
uniref:Uncharacterized protein n=1 Tax=Ditylenchus dipsaci TaxID=166011 RepID=A0A915EK64_9BILA